MTDKQIIIDGEQCEYLRDTGLCRLTYCFTEKSYDCSMCNDNPNCYYKQLKRKEQECEELKIYIESNEQQVKEVETLVMDNDRLINELDQLKQTLTEIKEICKKESGWVNCSDNMPTETAIFAEQILQKISECEVE